MSDDPAATAYARLAGPRTVGFDGIRDGALDMIAAVEATRAGDEAAARHVRPTSMAAALAQVHAARHLLNDTLTPDGVEYLRDTRRRLLAAPSPKEKNQ